MTNIAQITVNQKTLERKNAHPPRPVLLPDGEYQATLKIWQLSNTPGEARKGNCKLELYWQILYDGEPVTLRQFFNVAKTKRGLSAGWSSKLMRNYAALYGYPRHPLINPDDFNGCLIKAATRTVTVGRGNKKLTGKARYSVVESLIELIAGGKS